MQRPPRSFLIITRPPGPQLQTDTTPQHSAATATRTTPVRPSLTASQSHFANQYPHVSATSTRSPLRPSFTVTASQSLFPNQYPRINGSQHSIIISNDVTSSSSTAAPSPHRPCRNVISIVRYPGHNNWNATPVTSSPTSVQHMTSTPARPARAVSSTPAGISTRAPAAAGSTASFQSPSNSMPISEFINALNAQISSSQSTPPVGQSTLATASTTRAETVTSAPSTASASTSGSSSFNGPSTSSSVAYANLSPAAKAHLKYIQQRRAIKRSAGPICNGKVDTWEDQSNDFLCPICFEELDEAHITKCGHTYCYDCILKAIELKPNCPKCSSEIDKEELTPNVLLTQLIAKQRNAKKIKTDFVEAAAKPVPDADMCKLLASKSGYLNLQDINLLMTMLNRRKEILTAESKESQRQLLLEFLSQLHRIKQAEKVSLDREVSRLESDIKAVREAPNQEKRVKIEVDDAVPESESILPNLIPHGFNTRVPNNDNLSSSLAAKKSRINMHFPELVEMYFETRRTILYDACHDSMVPNDSEDFYNYPDSLNDFASTLTKVSRYSSFKPLATFSYSADIISNSNIVSSIEFDKDNEFFAIAGVTRKIKLFEYVTVVGSDVDIHCPNAELACDAKISCIGWSGYYKNKMASSDYEGCVTLWDTATAVKLATMNEHEKRVWSVDWSNGDPRLFASGSDDTKVKLWTTGHERSVATLDSKANVCCVKFCPENSFHIAFGSADHSIYYYDFRNPVEPLGILVGHKKAVSYVKYTSKNELVSASTDSNLKLWDLNTMDQVRSFRGHVNEKNFVGLATDGDYVACGSENNSLYVYYKKLPKPLFSFKFDNHQNMLHRPTQDDTTDFVSAVAWKKGSPVVVAANSQGAIKVLEMQ